VRILHAIYIVFRLSFSTLSDRTI